MYKLILVDVVTGEAGRLHQCHSSLAHIHLVSHAARDRSLQVINLISERDRER
jgi:hypothetical protein